MKTGVAAGIATVVFAIVAFKAAEWTRSGVAESAAGNVKSEAAAAVAPAGPSGSMTRIIPQAPVGSFDSGVTKYSTIVEVVNTGSSDATITGGFYKEDGDLWPVAMTTNLDKPDSFTGSFDALTLPAGHVLVISGGTTPATTPSSGLIGWGKLTTTGTVSVSTFFELRDGTTGVLYSRIGIAASRPDLSRFLIPRVHTRSGLDVAFAIVNTGSSPASITATLKDASGGTLAKRSMTMNGNTHQAIFAHQFFSLSNESDDRNYQYIVFNSASPTFAAIALAFEGGTQTSFPVDPLQ
ncbi:MAG TPA: hypothetical protein VKY31_11730 [Terriglobia bacterium]|nr:hypothetical protein [Terriglobia bacterium]